MALRSGLGMAGVAQAAAVGSLTYAVVLIMVAMAYCHVPVRQRASTAWWAVFPLASAVGCCLALERLWPVSPGEAAGVMIAGAFARAALVSVAVLPVAITALNRAYPGWTGLLRGWRGVSFS